MAVALRQPLNPLPRPPLAVACLPGMGAVSRLSILGQSENRAVRGWNREDKHRERNPGLSWRGVFHGPACTVLREGWCG
jgi:hypothetical protein